jgi:hypothetical protein
MLSSDIGQAHCDTARYWEYGIPRDDDREAARRALRGRSGGKATTNKGRVAVLKPAGAAGLKKVERVKGIEPSS